ncbi:fasciclin domain-containing protein [Micromonospora sp. WMMD1102]|uniref:fasciclin domain-containing protein n=1 Tax=Micromonospora sp. WMMD1102 TaxID=3016105 RepID=UPI0024156F05|nr:fasciclin domain-containing protein [Micromonospora sp. WMMD1102]MDG4788699.1 fasciclin domain-containing protein [Micromonospora sp. WMMD1102]
MSEPSQTSVPFGTSEASEAACARFVASVSSSRPSSGPAGRTRGGRLRFRAALLAATALLAAAVAGCTGDAADRPGTSAAGGTAGSGVTGPLCTALPAGTDPGNPAALADQPGDVALQWIPVLTRFEAAVRAAGLSAELRAPGGVTVLAPTDDAFARKFSEENLDDLMIHRRDELRDLVRAHLVAGAHPLADLVAAGTLRTLDGSTLPVGAAGSMARIGEQVRCVCADYRVAGGRIHIVDGVLGKLPTTYDPNADSGH